MQFKSLFILATLTTVSLATDPIPASKCNTGPVQCCNTVQKANSTDAAELLRSLGVVLSDVKYMVGVACRPINVGGIEGNPCSAQPACCKDNSFDGAVAVDCVPVNPNL